MRQRLVKKGCIDVSDWEVPAIDDDLLERVRRSTLKAAAQVLELALRSEEKTGCRYCFDVDLPVLWAPGDGRWGKAPKDPLTVRVSLSFNPDRDTESTFAWHFSLRDEIEEELKHGEDSQGLRMLRDGLRKLADDIDESLESRAGGSVVASRR